MGPLTAAFLDNADPAAIGDIEETLAALLARGRAMHPAVALDGRTFARHLGRTMREIGAIDPSDLQDLYIEDLYLACACGAEVPDAFRTFCDAYRPAATEAIRRLDPDRGFADEVFQRVVERLFTATADRPPRIRSYAGRGPLRGWVAIAAQRMALSLRRSEGRRKKYERTTDAVATAAGLETRLIRERYAPVYEKAVREALTGLPDRERVILRLSLVERVGHEQIARLYGVNQSTVSRWIGAAIAAVREEAHRTLGRALSVAGDDLESLARTLFDGIEITLTGLLRLAPEPRP